jgi:hypothetical protein
VRHQAGRPPVAVAGAGHDGVLLHGPYIPIDAGDWRVTFALRRPPADVAPDALVGSLNVASGGGQVGHVHHDLRAAEIADDGSWTALTLDLALDRMTMGVEMRAFSTGLVPLEARLEVGLQRPADVTARPPAVPRIRELAGTLARRTAEASSHRARRLIRR